MGPLWTTSDIDSLIDWSVCPRCGASPIAAARCRECHADLSGPLAAELADASHRARDILLVRQAIIGRLPTLQPGGARTAPVIAGFAAPRTSASAVTPVRSTPVRALPARPQTLVQQPPRSQVSVQSILAVAGAALVAIAAFVFTFLNAELTNFVTRTLVVAGITVVFVGGAWLLSRAKLRFSAEAVGALAAVFMALDVWSLSQLAGSDTGGLVYAAIGTAAASAVLIAIATAARIRTWLWSGVVAAMIAPALVGYAADAQSPWSAVFGHVAVGFVALGTRALVRRLTRRFDNGLEAESTTASVAQITVLTIVLFQVMSQPPQGPAGAWLSTAVVAALAILAQLNSRTTLPRFWSFTAGGLAVIAAGSLATTIRIDPVWLIATVPAAASIALGMLILVVRRHAALSAGATSAVVSGATSARAVAAITGAWTLTLFSILPASALAALFYFAPLTGLSGDIFGLGRSVGIAMILALAAVTLATWLLHSARLDSARLDSARLPGAARPFDYTGSVALGLATLTLLAIASSNLFSPLGHVIAGISTALVLVAVLTRMPVSRAWSVPGRALPAIGAHLVLLLAAASAWTDPVLSVIGGFAIVATIAVLATLVTAATRAAYVAVGFGYALVICATWLALSGLETIAVLCLTTSVASAIALLVTLSKKVPVAYWYAVLGVTAVPFALGVFSVLLVRSGWTALSTGVTFALALALVLTHRPGLTRTLRAAAAAILVPSLAVVVVCLGAQVLDVSASPVTLPVIAIIVAATLPGLRALARVLVRRGVPSGHVRAAIVAIEASALLTGAIAVLLALVRAAAGLGTTLTVLLVLGAGATAAAVFTRRRYEWAVAGASFTGALWCVWALVGVSTLEAYILPPTLGVALVGVAVLLLGSSAQRRPARAFYTWGLALAALPSLATLALDGSDNSGLTPWRAYALLAGSALLIAGVSALTTLPEESRLLRLRRLDVLVFPTLVIAIVVASAGAVQGIRWALSEDATIYLGGELTMLPVLCLALMATLLAVAGGTLLVGITGEADVAGGGAGIPSRIVAARLVYLPAVLYLVAGPIVAVRPGWLPILTLLALSLVVLAVMLVAAARGAGAGSAGARRAVTLPPVWLLFVIAVATAIAGWSERELRVEVFSLPLGIALLAAGVIAARAIRGSSAAEQNLAPGTPGTLTSWPMGFRGSWHLLAPGILATIGPSVLSTATDPLTWRAILVIALALTAILIGSLRRLGAPFILGIVVLPIENAIVFVVQIGRSIGAAPWWITLATAGAVLLVIAVTYERRVGTARGGALRLRDLT